MQLNTIIHGDALTVLQTLPSNIVDCVVTSPPYYGLRDYGTASWVGGNADCKHSEREEQGFEKWKQSSNRGNSKPPKSICPKCGAVRVDNQLGLEDAPEEYISRLVSVFREVRRILHPNGTLWLNIGDSYAGSNSGRGDCKPKDLIGIPWMLAFALRADGWYLRQDIIWAKPNPMPESVTDRCTKSHEYIFLLSKSKNYYFNHKAILEPAAYDGRKDTRVKGSHKYSQEGNTGIAPQTFAARGHDKWPLSKNGDFLRNKRDIWSVATKPYRGAHFATFPQELIVDCIKAGCPEAGIVLDPFFGSGTTGIVARKLEKNFIGIELNRKYIKIAEGRLRKEVGLFL